MKRSYLSLALAGMLFATACSQDQITGEIGGESVVTFTAELPSEVSSSRAYGEGKVATTLSYAIYEVGETTPLIVGNDAVTFGSDLKAKFDVSLVNGMSYDVIFWADAPTSIYTFNPDAQTITANYNGVTANQESYDAFYAVVKAMEVNGAAQQPVDLFRPFAQLNIGTNDTDQAATAGLVVDATQVKVKAYSTLNLYTGVVDGETTITYAQSAKAIGEFPVAGNDYLAMNYILVPADYSTYDVTFTTYEGATKINERTYTAVPLQRNYKTNIYGRLLTSTTEFNVEIKPAFIQDANNNDFYNYDATEDTYYVSTAVGLNFIVEKINAGDPNWVDANIALDGDIDLSVFSGRSVTSNWTPIGNENNVFEGVFDGKGYTIKNLSLVYNEPSYYIGFFGCAENATIKNVVFENIYVNVASDNTNEGGHIAGVAGYITNSTLENITVQGDVIIESSYEMNASSRVGVIAGGNYGGTITMKNIVINANEGSYVKANNCLGGLAGQLQGITTFENCSSNIDVIGYKFFAGGIIGLASANCTLTNCHTSGNVSINNGRAGNANDLYRVGGIVGGWDDSSNTPLTLVGCTYSGEISGKDANGTVAENFACMGFVGRGYGTKVGAKVIIDGVEFVYEGNGVYSTSAETVASKEDLPKAENGQIITNFTEDVTLFGDITLSAKETTGNSGYGATGVKVNEGAVLDGNGNTLTVTNAGGTWDCVIAATGGTIKNLTVAGAMRGIFMPGATADVYIDNVTFKNVIYTFNSDSGNKNYGVYISNCTINGWTSHSDAHKEVVYTNCTFGEGSGYAFCRPYGPTSFVGCDFSEGYEIDARGKVTFENCTLNGIALTSENIATLVISNIANVVEVK